MLKRAWDNEANYVLRYREGVGRPDDAAEATAFRLQCELRLLQLVRTEYEKYEQRRSQLRKYILDKFETAKSSKLLSSFDKTQISGPWVTKYPGENFALKEQVRIYQDSGPPKFGYIFLITEFDGSEYQTKKFYLEFEGKQTNFADGQ